MDFYQTTAIIPVTTIDETLPSISIPVTCPASSKAKLTFNISPLIGGYKIYRDGFLLFTCEFTDIINTLSKGTLSVTFIDDGNLTIGTDIPPTTTNFTVDESLVIPTPADIVSEVVTGGNLSGTYNYQITFYTVKRIASPITSTTLSYDIWLYEPSGLWAVVTSTDDLTALGFTLLSDPFTLVEPLVNKITVTPVVVQSKYLTVQQVRVDTKNYNLPTIQKPKVTFFTESMTVTKNVPFNVILDPMDVTIEILINALTGSGEKIKGIFSYNFNSTGNKSISLSDRCGMLYTMSPASINVVEA